jgi:hypothetical protein
LNVLPDIGLHPVLVDIGASGNPPSVWKPNPPSVWKPLAKQSVYVGFDPDLREMKETAGSGFYKRIIVNEAISADPSKRTVSFFLTKFPFCSSTLEPDTQALSNFHFYDEFTVERVTAAPATTLELVLRRLALDHLDWLKLDTQGTDLRIFMSLPDNLRSRVLALDVEPGLIDAYKGEDLFVDTHTALLKEGFWLSDLNIGKAVRVRESSLTAIIPDKTHHSTFARRAMKKSPAWCEARYLRTMESMQANRFRPSEYILLWAFALADGQTGFAMDVALEYERLFDRDEAGATMKRRTLIVLRKKAAVLLPLIKIKRGLDRARGRKV